MSFQFLCALKCLESRMGGRPQDLNTCTARTTYCRQMGHSLMRLPHLVQVTMCPHSSRTQSMMASMQIRHRLSSSSSCSCSRSPSGRQRRAGAPLSTAEQPQAWGAPCPLVSHKTSSLTSLRLGVLRRVRERSACRGPATKHLRKAGSCFPRYSLLPLQVFVPRIDSFFGT